MANRLLIITVSAYLKGAGFSRHDPDHKRTKFWFGVKKGVKRITGTTKVTIKAIVLSLLLVLLVVVYHHS